MKKLSSIVLLSGSILAGIVALVPMTHPVTAQTTTPGTGTTDTQQPRTTTTYESNEREQDNSGLWGLTGLVGLAGLLGRKKEEDRPATRRDDAPAYRDPNVR